MLLAFLFQTLFRSSRPIETEREQHALHFGTTKNDYIQFNYNMTSFSDSLTICTWMKRVHMAYSIPVVFNYYTEGVHQILIGANGRYNRVLGDHALDDLQDKFTFSVGQWFHYCLTWSSLSRKLELYLDGDLAATGQTSSKRTLYSSGTVRFNRLDNSENPVFIFGGILYQFNIFEEVLSREAIERIAKGGLCFDLGEFFGSITLSWHDVLAKPRTGSVKEVPGCDLEEEIRLKSLQQKVAEKPNRMKDDL